MFPLPYGETVYVFGYLAGAEDVHGNPVDAWAGDPGVAVDGCGFDPGTSTEPAEGNRNAVVTAPKLFCPTGTAITARDRVKVRGLTYQVIGDPGDWRHPMTGWRPGIEVNLERVSG